MKHVKQILFTLLIFPLDLLVNLLAYIVVPIALLGPTDKNLPRWARWWDEPQYGIDGDPYWQGPDHANGHQMEYWWRVKWLLRNKAIWWATNVLGRNLKAGTPVTVVGNPKTRNRESPGVSGFEYMETVDADGRPVWCYYYVQQWGSTHCVRLYFGWKLKGFDEHPNGIPSDDTATYVVNFSPWMGFTP